MVQQAPLRDRNQHQSSWTPGYGEVQATYQTSAQAAFSSGQQLKQQAPMKRASNVPCGYNVITNENMPGAKPPSQQIYQQQEVFPYDRANIYTMDNQGQPYLMRKQI